MPGEQCPCPWSNAKWRNFCQLLVCAEAPFCVTMTVAIEFHSHALIRAHVRSFELTCAHDAILPSCRSKTAVTIGSTPAIGRSTEIAALHPSGGLRRPVLRFESRFSSCRAAQLMISVQFNAELGWGNKAKKKKSHRSVFFFFSEISVMQFGTTPGVKRGGGGRGNLFRSPEPRLSDFVRLVHTCWKWVGGGGGVGSMKNSTKFVLVYGRRCA